MSFTFRQLISKLGPKWMVKDQVQNADGSYTETDSRVLHPIMAMLDATTERVRLGLRARMPGLAPEDALAYIGRDFRILRGPSEVTANYEGRLQRARDDWRVAGGPWAMMQQLRGYCSPYQCCARIFNNHGNCFTVDRDGARHIVESTAWNWDGASASSFGRFWVLLYMTTGSEIEQSQFDFAKWNFNEAAIAATGLADPYGALRATRIYDTTANAQHRIHGYIANFASGTWSATVFAKMDGVRYLWMQIGDAGDFCYFDLQTGAVGAAAGSAVGSISVAPNGFYRCTVTSTAASSTVYLGMSTSNGSGTYTGTGAAGIQIYRPSVSTPAALQKPWNRTTQKWGDATRWQTGKWGGDSGTWGSSATREDVFAIRSIVRTWKPAGTRCDAIIVCFNDTALAPGDTAPPLPDGTWGGTKYVGGRQVAVRHADAIYWGGTS